MNEKGQCQNAAFDVVATVIVQDDKTSEFSGMPAAAIRTGVVDFILPLTEIPQALATLVAGGKTLPGAEGASRPEELLLVSPRVTHEGPLK